MNDICTIINEHFKTGKEISIDQIKVQEEVREMCKQNVCGQYNKNWTCPPAVDSLDEIKKRLSQYNNCYVVYSVYNLKNSFDMKGMISGVVDFRDKLLNMKNDFSEEMKYMILGAGSCSLCEKCAYIKGEKCKRPSDAFISVEACGIDVMSLMRDNGLKYNNGQNTVTYIGLVLY